LINDTVSDNATFGGAGGSARGGGLNASAGILSLTNSTIVDNNVASGGAGGGLDVEAGMVTIANTIVALNTNGIGSGAPADDIAGTVSSASAYNLIGTGGSGGLVNGVNGNQVGVANPGLDPNGLQNNGGPTQTIALLPGSPAIGTGSNNISGVTVPTTDQRGVARPHDRIDIGAFEDRGFTLRVVAGSNPQSTTVNTAFANPLAVTVTSPYGEPVAGGIISFTVTPLGNGASATLSASDATIAADGQASVTATANGNSGHYSVTASAAGAEVLARFKLTNVAARGGSAAAGASRATQTAATQTAALGLGLRRADPAMDPPSPGTRQVPAALGQATTLAAGALTVSSATGSGSAPVAVPFRNGTGGPVSHGNGRASPARAESPAPRAEIRLASRGRGWGLRDPTKAKGIGLASTEKS